MTHLFTRILVLTVCAILFPHLTPALAETSKPTIADVHYGPHERQILDFYRAPGDGLTPVLFFIHGGGWMGGDKANPDFLENSLKAGISVVTINYRLIPDAIAAKIDPPVKACLDDAARALQFVRSQAAEWRIDKTRIAGSGGSAGGFSILYLAFHPDFADPQSADPVARESTRLTCVVAFVPQTSLDPVQMRAWIPNNDYGHHAFSLPSMQAFIDQREKLLPWIRQFSPHELASKDAPPIVLFYDTVPAPGQPAKDPPHSANFGAGLADKLKTLGVEHRFIYPGAPGEGRQLDLLGFFVEKLKPTSVK